MIGYICGILGTTPYTSESITKHNPSGDTICIHSVCIAPDYRGKGIAKSLIAEYVRRAKENGLYERALLICHKDLQVFYEKSGLQWRGKSEGITYGNYDNWQEMGVELRG